MILIFDKKHRSSRLENSMYFKLTKIENVEYHIFKTFSLSIKKIEFFKIKKKISDLTYQLNFLDHMNRMHDIMSMIHLKQIFQNFFNREISSSSVINFEEDNLYVMKKILRKKKQKQKNDYVVKWKKYKKLTWKFANRLKKNVFDMIKRFELIKSIK